MKKITNKLFEPYRFPRFWCILMSAQASIIFTGALDCILFLLWGTIAFLAFGTWVEDLEAGRHNIKKKNIITLLIFISSVLVSIGYMNTNDERMRVTVLFIIMLVMQFIFLVATIWERKRHK